MSFSTYLLRRLLLIIPTFLGITVLNFGIIQLAPGGPIESYAAKIRYAGGAGGGSATGESASGGASGNNSKAVTSQVIEELKVKYGFDKPIHVRYFMWLKSVLTFDFGYSHTFGRPVIDLINSKFAVSVRFGVASFLISYLVCIPLGIFKALKDGTNFDYASSFVVFLLYSIPNFILAILLIHFFAGGRYFDFFPLGGLTTLDSESWSTWARIKDQAWHMFLPLVCLSVNSFATLTILMKNSIIEEVKKDYIRTAYAKGLTARVVIFKHGVRNALIPIATGFGGIITVFFASNLLIERIFNLDGFGKLLYDSALQRDYPVIMAQVAIGAMLGLFAQLISDVAYVLVDPRINYSSM